MSQEAAALSPPPSRETDLGTLLLERTSLTEEQLNQAREDVEDAVLFAPFSGRVTGIHVTQGAVVEAGTAVVTLTLMDPIQVQVAVSADHDRRIHTGERAFLYPKNPVTPNAGRLEVPALVFEKGSVADPDTHTFRIDLMARNERLLRESAGTLLEKETLTEAELAPLFEKIDA